MKNDRLMETSCGSPHYASPEVVQGQKYDGSKADAWSLGVLLYGLCAGRLPFDDHSIPRLLEKVCKGTFVMPNHFDGQLRDLVAKLLVVSPDQRMTLANVKSHPWWIDKCRAFGFPMDGSHLAQLPPAMPLPSGNPPDSGVTSSSSPASGLTRPTGPPPIPPRKASSSSQQSSASTATSAARGSMIIHHPLLQIKVEDIGEDELKKYFTDLQNLALSIAEENAILRDNFQCPRTLPQASQQATAPTHPAVNPPESALMPIPPQEMQLPVQEPLDEEVLEFITVQQGWADVDSLTKQLKDPAPSLDKAFYKLLLQQKSAYSNLNHLRHDLPSSVSPNRPIKLVEQSADANAPLESLLRNCRIKTDTALLRNVDADPAFAPAQVKKKGKGIFGRVFGGKGGKPEEGREDSTNHPSPMRAKAVTVVAPEASESGSTNVQRLGMDMRQKSAPMLIKREK
eukprot:NODE_623_length_2038_cov_30.421820_g575_i0.p1 GENE.NODE_623_length_2038_cov_30.421820_g575_i0~~NODE_623_length_2038_cov_30.421820_g575_i0.p1  ORF type:complete len:534 (+),score=98.94 NODE_623_length_2038_cov_30.421820_g575_i0:238-1602(+)